MNKETKITDKQDKPITYTEIKTTRCSKEKLEKIAEVDPFYMNLCGSLPAIYLRKDISEKRKYIKFKINERK